MLAFRWMELLRFLTLLTCLSLGMVSQAAELSLVKYADLPREAKVTIALIKQGGPFPYDKDGTVFGNYEKILPKQSRGYYHEFTVKTPYARNRGARRLIAGGQSPRYRFFYTDDHYRSFREVVE